MDIDAMLRTPVSRILIAIILGLGIPALFYNVCNTSKCIIVQGPPPDTIRNRIYSNGGKCYKFNPYARTCPINENCKKTTQ